MTNQLQDVSTKVFVNCVQDKESLSCTQLTKTFGSKRPAVDLSLTVVVLLKKELNQWINATMSLYSINTVDVCQQSNLTHV